MSKTSQIIIAIVAVIVLALAGGYFGADSGPEAVPGAPRTAHGSRRSRTKASSESESRRLPR